MKQEAWYWYWFCNIESIGHVTKSQLLEVFSDVETIYHLSEEQVASVLKPKQVECFLQSRNDSRINRELEKLQMQKIRFLWRTHPDYPKRLLHLHDAPYGIYVKGQLPAMSQRTLAIVGARNADYYGLEMARYFGRELAKAGVGVISGLAYGVDAHAHMGALQAEGYTLGILGCGINVCYPKENYKIFYEMEQKGGILSEYGFDVSPRPGLFPLRNRLIAAMADGILVTQAQNKSGSLITVDQGLEQGKDIFALPGRMGDTLSEGCNHMIQSGAKLVLGVSDILEEWGENIDETKKFQIHQKNILVNEEKIVYSVLRLEPKFIDTIIVETRMPVTQVLPILMTLESKGYIKQNRHNYYSVVI